MVSVLLPTKHIEALAQMKKDNGETRSEVIRHLVAVYLHNQATKNSTVREILGEELR